MRAEGKDYIYINRVGASKDTTANAKSCLVDSSNLLFFFDTQRIECSSYL